MFALTGIPAAPVVGTFVTVILIASVIGCAQLLASVIGCAQRVFEGVPKIVAEIYGALKTVVALFIGLAFNRAHPTPRCVMTDAGNTIVANAGSPLRLEGERAVAPTTGAEVRRANALVVTVLVCSAFRLLFAATHDGPDAQCQHRHTQKWQPPTHNSYPRCVASSVAL
jgi:hypothetical protein